MTWSSIKVRDSNSARCQDKDFKIRRHFQVEEDILTIGIRQANQPIHAYLENTEMDFMRPF